MLTASFRVGDNAIDVSTWPLSTLLCINTFEEASSAMYMIRKESATSIFCVPIKSSAKITLAKNGENALKLTDSANVGGAWTAFYA